MGLKEEIKNAATAAEVEDLLKVGKGYANASFDTRRKWHLTANERLNELSPARRAKAEAKAKEEAPAEIVETPKKKKKKKN